MKKRGSWSETSEPDVSRICVKCGKANSGRLYTVQVKDRQLRPRPANFAKAAMHKECAEEWVKRAQITPDNVHEVQEIAYAYKVYQLAVERGRLEIEAWCKRISNLDGHITSLVSMYHRAKSSELKREKPEPINWTSIWLSPDGLKELEDEISLPIANGRIDAVISKYRTEEATLHSQDDIARTREALKRAHELKEKADIMVRYREKELEILLERSNDRIEASIIPFPGKG